MAESRSEGWLHSLLAQARKSPLSAVLMRAAKSKPQPVERKRGLLDELEEEIRRGDAWDQAGVWQGKGPEPTRHEADE
jgi:hypothetical protein